MSIIIEDKAAYTLPEVEILDEALTSVYFPGSSFSRSIPLRFMEGRDLARRVHGHLEILMAIEKDRKFREELIQELIEAEHSDPLTPYGRFIMRNREEAAKAVDIVLNRLKERELFEVGNGVTE